MEIPRFEKRNVNPRIVTADLGDAFQSFVHELLSPQHPQLHRFPGGGKDGGIDLIEAFDTCFVVECKVVGDDDCAQIEQRWKIVKGHLEEHLRDPNGPTKGQSQYLPWYSTDTPIVQYVFSVTAAFANEQQRRELRKKITDYFHDLAKRRPHLSHLGVLKVSVIDWNDLCDLLRKRPHSIFRWFPAARPNSLVPLDESVDVGTFRNYLNNSKLPYHSLGEHLLTTPAPNGITILSEDNLLAHFENHTITGLVINGKGGIGKSRLMLELGWEALNEGWTVMRVQGRFKDNALEAFVEKLTPETPALLLVDYIETQNDFGELVENLNMLNDNGVARIHYVAVCRTGYYHRTIAASGRHLPVDLSPPPGDVALEWFTKYRSETVQRILTKSGIAVTERHVAVCRDLPILAVFLAYLHSSGRSEDLTELLAEIEFGRWVARRVQLIFPAKDVSRDLALLVPLFPMADAATAKLHQAHFRPIFDRLATDGWIERITPSMPDSFNEWVTAHDVLADQILLSYIRSIPNTAETFVVELFSLATELGCLGSAIVSLQRIADSPPLNTLPWSKIIADAIAANKNDWRKIRDLLIRTSLLIVPERIALLHSHKDFWVDAEQNIGFQNALGWFARWTATDDGKNVPEHHKQDLNLWILKAAPFAEKSNFVITWGLRLSPVALQDYALRWVNTRPHHFQTHYLMVAWLECNLPTASIAMPVQRWCQKFSKTSHLSFVAKAWLYAGGDTELIQEAIRDWLVEYKTDAEARFVYKSWLDAGGETALIQEAIRDWLVEHKTDTEAQFVYKSWLDAGGETALIQEAFRDWLVEHKTDAEARFVYKSWLDTGGETALIREAIRDWLVEYKTDVEAQFVYKSWLDAGGETALIQEAIRDWLVGYKTDAEARFVYKSWLDAGGETSLIQEAIRDWLVEHKTDTEARFVYKSWLDAGGETALIQEAIRDWLVEHKTDVEAQFVYKSWLDAGGETALIQDAIRDWLVGYKTDAEARFVYKSWLDAGGETALIQEAIRDWLVEHKTDTEADFVYRAWLDAGGERDVVWDSLLIWLAKYKTNESAVYITKFVAKQRNLPPDTIKHILEWCRVFSTDEDALWRLTHLRNNFYADGVGEDVVLTSETVLADLILPKKNLTVTARGQITTLISHLLTLTKSAPIPLQNRVDSMFMNWLRHPLSFGNGLPLPHSNIQRPIYVHRLRLLVEFGLLDVNDDREALERFMKWLNTWEIGWKQPAWAILHELKQEFPAPGLWDILQLGK